ncbi:S1C family serine protease [Haloarculaceae archaeon H-GB2-1]|nr:S1C family serine protease [Haloarculaceae archaeon H-GB1-1]MEA5387286.1 S1C family serine protease [Haloarculaceae archaeon H-GB11]MEA5408752.1 S1C family serine protease [Haloarculaceae archaeon H-GB2-1]
MSSPTSYERLYSDTISSVVSIYVADRTPDAGGTGSGFVYESTDGRGHLLTNQHVVGEAPAVDVRFSDGTWSVGEVVGTDAYTDLAVVAVEDLPEEAEPLPMAASNPRPGQPVAALVTSDTLGAHADRDSVTGTVSVVGVDRARAGHNIGFAVSAVVVRRVAPVLLRDGTYRHPHLKMKTLDVSPTVAEANSLDEPGGVLVMDVRLGPSSGALPGCEETRTVRGREVPIGGDVIVGVDDTRIRSHEELMRYLLLETKPGEPIDVRLLRDGEPIDEALTLGERPATDAHAAVA